MREKNQLTKTLTKLLCSTSRIVYDINVVAHPVILAPRLTLLFLLRRETVPSEAQCWRGICGQHGQAEVRQRKPENL